MFDDVFSIESVGLYKPHSHVYRWAAHRAKVDVSECLLVAAHGWDVAGAEWAGMETAFVARPQQQLFLLGQTQSLTVSTLEELAGRLWFRSNWPPGFLFGFRGNLFSLCS